MKNKIFGCALLFIITAAGAWAQNLPNVPNTTTGLWSSPQSTITEGRYRSNADNFIRPDQYTGVSFDKWFGMVSFLSDDNNSAIATVGLATKISDLYFAMFYSGNMWAGKPVNNYIEQEPGTVPAGGADGKVYDVYTSTPNVATGPVNNVALLFGIGNMGFRITYRTNYQSFKENNIVVDTTPTGQQNRTYQLYSDYYAENGYIAPQVAWALAKDLTKDGIRPYLTVDGIFNRDYQQTKTAGDDSFGNKGELIGRSSNHTDPSFAVGLGGYHIYNKDGFRLTADLDYVLSFKIYNNEYSYIDNGVYKTGNIKGTYSPGSNPYIERSFNSNLVTPSLSGQWSRDKLALRFKFNLPLTFENDEQNSMTQNESGKLVYNNASSSSSSFIFRPDLRLALQFKIVPDKLTLNAGARLQATAATLKTVVEKSYDNGKKVYTRKLHQDSYGSGFVSRFSIGPTLNFTENAWVEAATGVTNVYGDGAIDVFAPGGFFSFGSILVGLKF